MSEGQVIFPSFLSKCTIYISGNVNGEAEAALSHEQLASEVKQLTKERDHLLAQAKKDSDNLERKEIVLKAQYEEQLKDSAIKISQVKNIFSQDIHENIL